MSYAPTDVPPTLVWRPGSGLSGPMVYDDFTELVAACASTPTVIDVQCDGSLLPAGDNLVLPAGTYDFNGAILTGPRNVIDGLTPNPDPNPRRVVALFGTTLRGVGGARDGLFLENAQGAQPVVEIVDFGVWIQSLSVLIGASGPVLRGLGSFIAFLEAGCDWDNEGAIVAELTQPLSTLQVSVGLDSSIDDDVISAPLADQAVQIGRSTVTSRAGTQAGVANLFIQTDGELENLRFNGPFGAFSPPEPTNMQQAWDRLVNQVTLMLGRPIDAIAEPLPVLLSFPADEGQVLATQRAYFVDTSVIGGNLNLPVSFTAQGRIFVKNTGNQTVALQPAPGETVDGALVLELVNPNESVILISNGAGVWGVF